MTAVTLPAYSTNPGAVETGSATDAGRERGDEPNQDSLRVLPSEGGRPLLLIVADGMGGHAGGALASQMVVEAVAIHYYQATDYRDLGALLGDCLQHAHQVLKNYVASHAELASMGSTAVLAAVRGEQVFFANVGDSRAYLIRGRKAQAGTPTLVSGSLKRKSGFAGMWAGIAGRLRGNRSRPRQRNGKGAEPGPEMLQLSYDHSVVADQIRAGLITPLQALHSTKRNQLTQSITPRRAEITPYIAQMPFSPEDTLLLCTDGLWGVIPEATIQAIAGELPPQAAVEKLIALTLASGAPDNVTAVIARKRGAQTAASVDEDDTDPGL
jgi:serine/threonine protein phosphatase PrpC